MPGTAQNLFLVIPGSSDIGVYRCRRLLRELVRGNAAADPTKPMSSDGGETLHAFGSDTTLHVPGHADKGRTASSCRIWDETFTTSWP
ncbi:MAG: hypothetical protein ACR2PI_25000, partial [Hyphomicrobiaceae bacterium]